MAGRSSSICAVKHWSQKYTWGASYRPRHTPLESEFEAPDKIVNSRKERLSAVVSPCQTRPTLHELGTCFVQVRGRTKTAPVGRPHAVKSPETHSRTHIEQCAVVRMSFAS